MEINIKCNISLSKKIRALIGNSETTFTLTSGQIKDGRGVANISLSLDNPNNVELNDFMNKETSVMFTPIEMDKYIPNGEGVTNIFASNSFEADNQSNMHPAIKRLAAFDAPNSKKDIPHLIKSKHQIDMETPKAFEVVKNPEVKRFINEFDQLMEEASLAKNKTYPIDVSKITDPRKKAIAMVEKEKAESIDCPAYVVNEKCKSITINDLGISLSLNVPYDLSNISAKRLAASKDLPAMFKQGYVKFVSPDEIVKYFEKVKRENDTSELEVFGGKTGSAKMMARNGGVDSSDDYDDAEMTMDELDTPTEQERLANLNKAPSYNRREDFSDGSIRESSHGNVSEARRQVPTQQQNKKPNGLKTIRRAGLDFN